MTFVDSAALHGRKTGHIKLHGAEAFEAMRTYKPLTEDQLNALAAKTKQAAMTGSYEPFKTTGQYDGTTANPQTMG